MRLVTFALVIGPLGLVGYAYLLYPLMLKLLGSFRRRATRPATPTDWPVITITLPVYNEESTIRAALDALLEADYPPDRRQILVVSDASTDRTDERVREYAGRGVELIRLPVRKGKTAAENAAGEHVRGEIVVNTDASVRIDRHALKPLIASFTDASVGVASGRDVSVATRGDEANLGEFHYVGYEMWVRALETHLGGIVGASGCLFATRAALHRLQVPEGLSRDFAAPLIARERGYRSVAVNDAVGYVPRAPSLRREYRRKVRTMTRGLETLFYKRALLNPFRYGLFAWKLFSHKLARWLVPWAVAGCGVGLILLAPVRPWAQWGLAAMGLVGFLALLGWRWAIDRPVPRLLALAGYVVSGTAAGLAAWRHAVRGEFNATWDPTSRQPLDAN